MFSIPSFSATTSSRCMHMHCCMGGATFKKKRSYLTYTVVWRSERSPLFTQPKSMHDSAPNPRRRLAHFTVTFPARSQVPVPQASYRLRGSPLDPCRCHPTLGYFSAPLVWPAEPLIKFPAPARGGAVFSSNYRALIQAICLFAALHVSTITVAP